MIVKILQRQEGAFLAQMVERWPFKPMAVGSIPTEGVLFFLQKLFFFSTKNAPTRDRTEDLSVNSRTLCQLSHGGMY